MKSENFEDDVSFNMNERELNKKLEQKCAEFVKKRDAKILKSLQEKLDKAHKIAGRFSPSEIRKSTCSRKQPPEVCQQMCKCNCIYGLALLIKSGYSISISEKIKYVITKREPMEESKTVQLTESEEFVKMKSENFEENSVGWEDSDFDELDISETEVLSADYARALKLDKHIKAHAQIAQESLYEVCKGLKEMRDNKLYKELNYSNFEEYCNKELGISRQQSYKYLGIAENLSEDFVKSTLQIGTEKLSLLARLDEPEREQIQKKTDLEQTSVRELKNQIAQLKDEKNKQKNELEKIFQERDEKEQARASIAEAYRKLFAQVEELKKKPLETVTVEDTTKIEELEAKLKEVQSRLDEKERKLAELSVQAEPLYADSLKADEREFNALLNSLRDSLSHLVAFTGRLKKNESFSTKYYIEKVQKLINTYTDVMQEDTEHNRKEEIL